MSHVLTLIWNDRPISALEVFKLPKPVQTNQNQENRNLNSPQNQVANMQAGGKYCFKCQGEDWDACTQDKNKVLCGQDQDVCFVEMRSQQGKPVSQYKVSKLNNVALSSALLELSLRTLQLNSQCKEDAT